MAALESGSRVRILRGQLAGQLGTIIQVGSDGEVSPYLVSSDDGSFASWYTPTEIDRLFTPELKEAWRRDVAAGNTELGLEAWAVRPL